MLILKMLHLIQTLDSRLTFEPTLILNCVKNSLKNRSAFLQLNFDIPMTYRKCLHIFHIYNAAPAVCPRQNYNIHFHPLYSFLLVFIFIFYLFTDRSHHKNLKKKLYSKKSCHSLKLFCVRITCRALIIFCSTLIH